MLYYLIFVYVIGFLWTFIATIFLMKSKKVDIPYLVVLRYCLVWPVIPISVFRELRNYKKHGG